MNSEHILQLFLYFFSVFIANISIERFLLFSSLLYTLIYVESVDTFLFIFTIFVFFRVPAKPPDDSARRPFQPASKAALLLITDLSFAQGKRKSLDIYSK